MVIAVCFGILLAMLILRILHYLPHIILILFALWLIGSAHSEPRQPFSFEKEHERQAACQMYYQALQECTSNNVCNQTLINELQRRCAFFK